MAQPRRLVCSEYTNKYKVFKSIQTPVLAASIMLPTGETRELLYKRGHEFLPLDKGIESNLDAALIQHKLNKNVKYGVKSGVVTLTGEVNSQARRAQAEQIAAGVPNVKQVVNELQIKNQKATSSP